ncbi:hypothetical protein DPMN_148576 [Dreissena polymorpha]|uniref:Uncharacterized protein n=2 Tax=Dreissena polymorpha TaxID=45954 RepID=A0A9D4FC00_DREPO|nr:hypothetical protein DPMN_148576 [Dreissena polymorpha]
MNILSEENPELSALNNDILVNTLFNVSQKNIHKIHTKDEWIFVTMQMLCDGLKNKFVPSFYLPRMNLLDTYGIRGDKRKKAFEKLSEIIQELRSNPRSIFRYTGCVETKPKRKVTVDSKTSPDAQIGEHGDIVNETENDAENGTANDENLNNYEDNVEDETHDQLLELPDELLYRLPSPPQHHQEETSDISRLTKQGDRSDIY